jgi:hypothetical protein
LMGCHLVGELLNRFTLPQTPDSRISDLPLLPLVVAALFSAVVLALNPNTVKMIPYAFQTVSIGPLQDFIQEWAVPDFHNLQFHPFIWLLLLTLAAFGLSHHRTDWSDLLLVSVFAYLSLLAVRNVALFALVAAPVLSRHAVAVLDNLTEVPHLSWLAHLTGSRRATPTRPDPVALNVFFLILVIAGAGAKVGVDLVRINVPEVWGQGLPVEAAQWLGQHELPGQMFNTYNWGGYLIWSLYPDKPVFVDGRTDLYALKSQVLDDYVTVHWAQQGWEDVLDRYDVGHVILERTSPLDNTLRAQVCWVPLYEDDISVIYVRTEDKP